MVTAPSAETDANRHQSARGRNHPSFTLKCISNQGASFTPTSPERLLPARGIISRVGIDVRRYRWGCARLPAAAKIWRFGYVRLGRAGRIFRVVSSTTPLGPR